MVLEKVDEQPGSSYRKSGSRLLSIYRAMWHIFEGYTPTPIEECVKWSHDPTQKLLNADQTFEHTASFSIT